MILRKQYVQHTGKGLRQESWHIDKWLLFGLIPVYIHKVRLK